MYKRNVGWVRSKQIAIDVHAKASMGSSMFGLGCVSMFDVMMYLKLFLGKCSPRSSSAAMFPSRYALGPTRRRRIIHSVIKAVRQIGRA